MLNLIAVALRLLNGLMSWLSRRSAVQAGEDKAVAREAMKVLQSTAEGRRLRERIKMMDDEEANKLWDDLVT